MLKDLKVVFMGTPQFSLNVLEMLINNTKVIGVVTQPDKVVGRGNQVSYSKVKELALKYDIKVIQPIKIRNEYQEILDLNPDIIITCAYGQIIPSVILDYPKYGCINVHASLLPKLRGGAPLHHAIIDGYQKTGITIMYMDKGMDTGDIISQEEVEITDSDNLGTLHDKLSVLGAELLEKTLPSIIAGTNKRIKQNEEEVTFGYNISRSEELIDFNKNCREIFNQIRGLNPFPGAHFMLNNFNYKVYSSTYTVTEEYQNYQNGEVVIFDKTAFAIKCSDGLIYILDLQKEGKKRMTIKDFLNGNKENLLGGIVDNDQ